MNLLDRYIWRNALAGIVMAWFALITLDSFFALVNELEDVDENGSGYRSVDAILYIIYTLPEKLYEYFPSAILVGALLGLGRLSANSEFTAMRAAGVSIRQVVLATLQLGAMLALFTFVLGEWVVPVTDNYAQTFQAERKNNKVKLTADRSLWVKEGQELIHIEQVVGQESLSGITIYRLDGYHRLQDITTIEQAVYVDGEWKQNNVVTRIFSRDGVRLDRTPVAYSKILVKPDILEVAVAKPDQLSSHQLKKLIQHQEYNGLSASRFELAYWKHYSIPLSALVMLVLALPFLFISQRSPNMGQQIFIGIVVGIGFYLINRVLNELGSVYGLSPFVSAFLPVVLFFIASLVALKQAS